MSVEAASAKTPAPAPEPIYVFGSDLSGRHDQHSAALAARLYAAETGVSNGATGNAYAIPYRNSTREILPLGVISNYVKPFFQHAQSKPQDSYQIARFGSEPGAHGDADMARLFALVPDNCQLPGLWLRVLDPRHVVRLLVFDPGAHLKDGAWQDQLSRYLSLNAPLWNASSVEMVSVGGARAIVANDAAAKRLGLKHRIFGLNEARFGREAQTAAEARAVWYSTHFLSICDFEQTAQPQQIRMTGTATRGGLTVDQLDTSSD